MVIYITNSVAKGVPIQEDGVLMSSMLPLS
uniref:Uncharacterized protein n=1 Tax=Arundo donax TaxID=35708 RepID=A0A0A9F8B0_ARUDO